MSLFRRHDDYDRTRLLREARDAQRRGRHRNAIRHLRRILVVEPNSVEIHGSIAPSLAVRGLEFCAWESYQRAASACFRDGKKQLALDLYRDATRRMPRHFEAWQARAALERRMGRDAQAKRSLERALKRFRRRSSRDPRIALLRQIIELDPSDSDALVELAWVLSKTDQKQEALFILTRLAESPGSTGLRRVRRTQWRIEPSLVHSWLWLRAAIAC